ncbi:hypothetical protein AYI69_g4832 [Smittium culicis]|uniref:Uncharacterized protein n=1 Tax=Smittium culicis TaxID=133412 RepID=A0A1R1YAN4_9FUNG|nr:hypothetical protein AYI69_g4832 [Smittium culicis]
MNLENLVLISSYLKSLKFFKSFALKKIILLNGLPCLASVQDAVSTAQVVRISLSIYNLSTSESSLITEKRQIHLKRNKVLAIRILGRIVMFNDRVWPDFLSLIDKHFFVDFNGSYIHESDSEFELFSTIITALNEMVGYDPDRFSGKILALLSQKVGRVSDSDITQINWHVLSILIKSIIECTVYGAIDAQVVWKALSIERIASFLFKGFLSNILKISSKSQKFYSILSFIDFFEIIPKNSSYNKGSEEESKSEFLKSILDEFLIPLSHGIYQNIDTGELSDSTIRVFCRVLNAISNFPIEMWINSIEFVVSNPSLLKALSILPSKMKNNDESHSIISGISKFLSVLMDVEMESMARSVIKGNSNSIKSDTDFPHLTDKILSKSITRTDALQYGRLSKISYIKSKKELEKNINYRIKYILSIFEKGSSSYYGVSSGLSLLYISFVSKYDTSYSSSCQKSLEKIDFLINDVNIISDHEFISGTLITIFSRFFASITDSIICDTIFNHLKDISTSNKTAPHIKANSIYAIGGLIKSVKNHNPQLASALSEQFVTIVEVLLGKRLSFFSRSSSSNYWDSFIRGNIDANSYKDDVIVSSIIYSSLECTLAMPSGFDYQAQFLHFIANGLSNLYKHVESFGFMKYSMTSCCDCAINLLNFLNRGNSKSNTVLNNEIMNLTDVLENTKIFSNIIFKATKNPIIQDEFESISKFDSISPKNSSWFLDSVSNTAAIIVKLQLINIGIEEIKNNQKLALAYLSEKVEAFSTLSDLEKISFFATIAYLCLSFIDVSNDLNKNGEHLLSIAFDTLKILEPIFFDGKISFSSSRDLNYKILKSTEFTVAQFLSTCTAIFSRNFSDQLDSSYEMDTSEILNEVSLFIDRFKSQKAFLNSRHVSETSALTLDSKLSQNDSKHVIVDSILNGFISVYGPTVTFNSNQFLPFNGYNHDNIKQKEFFVNSLDNMLGIPNDFKDFIESERFEGRLETTENLPLTRVACWILSIIGINTDTAVNNPVDDSRKKPQSGEEFQPPSIVNDSIIDSVALDDSIKSFIQFGNPEPQDLNRLSSNSICRVIWENLNDSSLPPSTQQNEIFQTMLWMSILLMKWPFPVVDTSKKFDYVATSSKNISIKLISFLVCSKFSDYMYSASKSMIKSIVYSLILSIETTSIQKNSDYLRFALKALDTYGLGKILELSGLDLPYNDKNMNYSYIQNHDLAFNPLKLT